MTVNPKKKPSFTIIGCILVVISYILLVPAFVFMGIGLAGKGILWCRAAGAIYALTWVLFIAGVLLAGGQAAKAATRWMLQLLKGKPALIPPVEPANTSPIDTNDEARHTDATHPGEGDETASDK